MKTIGKRVLALLLAAVLTVTLGAAAAWAKSSEYPSVRVYADGLLTGRAYRYGEDFYLSVGDVCGYLGLKAEERYEHASRDLNLEAPGLTLEAQVGRMYVQVNGRWLLNPRGILTTEGRAYFPVELIEKIFNLLSRAKLALEGEESNGGAEAVDIAASAMQDAASYNADYQGLSDALTDVYYNLRDCMEALNDAVDNLESDPQRLEEIEERLDLLNRLTRKYNCQADELPALAEQMQTRLEELLNYDRDRDELIAACAEAKEKAAAMAEKLSDLRKKAANTFAAKVKEEMRFLNMPNVELIPRFESTELTPDGIDKAELLISANPGETPRPVAKIASGGELSRMMLAIKTVLAATDDVDTLIFDEVDTGISGSAAEKVGLKLKQVSRESQVLCVTHQAQIAALADHHYLIEKRVEQGRTFTVVSPLDHGGRVKELARIIGGVDITQAALSHAEDMLGRACS